MRISTLTLLKALLCIPIGIGLAYPLLFAPPEAPVGILGELQMFGPLGSALVIAAFLLLILFYALDLIRTLKLVSPAARTARPGSVWLMFLLPYNFIEDFFIVAHVARSLRAEAAINPALAGFTKGGSQPSFGMISGLGWCSAQIVSLIPNALGSAAGLLAIGCWVWHWAFIRRVNAALAKSPAALTDAKLTDHRH
jgi:hypothetical protein